MNPKLKQNYQNELLSEIAVLKQYTQALQLKNKQLFKQKQDLQTQLRNVRLNFKGHSVVNPNISPSDSKYNTSDSKYNSDFPKTATSIEQNQLRQKYQRLLIDYNRLKNKARSTKINYDIYQKQNTNLSRQKYVLQEKVGDLQTEVKAVKSMNNSLLSNNQSFDKSYYTNQQNINGSMSYNQYEARHLNDKIQQLQKVISMKNQQIAKYQAELDQKNQEFSKMKTDIQSYYQKMTQMQNELGKSKNFNSSSYKYADNSQTISILNDNISTLKGQNIKLQQKNQILQNRIQYLEETNLNLTKQLRDKSEKYYPFVSKLSQTTPTQGTSMTTNAAYRLVKSVVPNYHKQYLETDHVPSYYLGEVQSRYINKKAVDSPPVVIRQNALYNSNISALRGARYQSSLSNESRRLDSLQRKIQNLAFENKKLRNVLVNQRSID